MIEPRARIELSSNIYTRRRSGHEILYDFFKTLSHGPVIPTHLMYGSGLNHVKMTKVIKTLLENGLLIELTYHTKGRKKTKRKAYSLTNDGFLLLKKMREFMTQMDCLI